MTTFWDEFLPTFRINILNPESQMEKLAKDRVITLLHKGSLEVDHLDEYSDSPQKLLDNKFQIYPLSQDPNSDCQKIKLIFYNQPKLLDYEFYLDQMDVDDQKINNLRELTPDKGLLPGVRIVCSLTEDTLEIVYKNHYLETQDYFRTKEETLIICNPSDQPKRKELEIFLSCSMIHARTLIKNLSFLHPSVTQMIGVIKDLIKYPPIQKTGGGYIIYQNIL